MIPTMYLPHFLRNFIETHYDNNNNSISSSSSRNNTYPTQGAIKTTTPPSTATTTAAAKTTTTTPPPSTARTITTAAARTTTTTKKHQQQEQQQQQEQLRQWYHHHHHKQQHHQDGPKLLTRIGKISKRECQTNPIQTNLHQFRSENSIPLLFSLSRALAKTCHSLARIKWMRIFVLDCSRFCNSSQIASGNLCC